MPHRELLNWESGEGSTLWTDSSCVNVCIFVVWMCAYVYKGDRGFVKRDASTLGVLAKRVSECELLKWHFDRHRDVRGDGEGCNTS